MEFELFVSEAEKIEILNLMNYKLKVEANQNFPLIKLSKIFLVEKNGFDEKLLNIKGETVTKDASSTKALSDNSIELVNPESMFSSFNSN
jgi:hypothetical protein